MSIKVRRLFSKEKVLDSYADMYSKVLDLIVDPINSKELTKKLIIRNITEYIHKFYQSNIFMYDDLNQLSINGLLTMIQCLNLDITGLYDNLIQLIDYSYTYRWSVYNWVIKYNPMIQTGIIMPRILDYNTKNHQKFMDTFDDLINDIMSYTINWPKL
jgi:hypothetical protein